MTDFAIIMGLRYSPGASLNAFSAEKKINKAILSKAVKKLQANGLVILEKDPAHKQRYQLYITEEAKKLIPRFRSFLNAYEAAALQSLNDTEKRTLLDLLIKVYQQEIDA